MKRLYLLRHGEAAQNANDFDRPLTSAGRTAMQALGARLTAQGDIPARVLCSPSLRTRQTWTALGMGSIQPIFEDKIYDATPGTVLALVQEAADVPSLMIIGHNPAIHALAGFLASHGDEVLLQKLNLGFAAGALAVIGFDFAWRDVIPYSGTLLDFISP